ncbi:hypothetical protein Scep_014219 [Stephania cephalantha]|uniref:Uncharacterized protein n=1 Tax=Stephania cephalantha TaxID=152367 RepID=A0AAP0J2N8_9MAGN
MSSGSMAWVGEQSPPPNLTFRHDARECPNSYSALGSLWARRAGGGMTKFLRIYGSTVPNCRRDPIIFEETEGNFSSDGEGEFKDEENYVNFDEPPKFDDDDQGFIEDTVVIFGDESRVVTNIPLSTSASSGDVDFNEVSLDFFDHIDLVGLESVIEKFVLFSIIKLVKLSFEEKVIPDRKPR